MHPMKKESIEGVTGHNAKLRRMTAHYGDANPKMKKLAPVDEAKEEGSEDSVGYGADSANARAKGDRKARTSKAANPVSTYKKGGRIKAKRRAEGGDVSDIQQANVEQKLAAQGRARGGRTKHKGTHVNVIVAPQGGGGAGAAPAASPMPAMPPMMPKPPMPAAPPPGPMPGAGMPPGMPMAPGAPGGMPPGMMPPRAKGGAVNARARGGRLPNQKHKMTAGAVTGEGRLEKIGKKPEKPQRPQAV